MEAADTCSTNANKVIETNRVSLVRHVARTRNTNKYRRFVRHPAEKRRLGRPRRRSEDNSKMGRKDVDWIQLAQEREKWCHLANRTSNRRVL